MQLFHNKSFDAVKKLGPGTVKVYVWLPSSSLIVGRLSRGNPEPLIRAKAERRGLPFDVVAGQVCCSSPWLKKRCWSTMDIQMFSGATGRVVEDGINPPMHDYENQPQQVNSPSFWSQVLGPPSDPRLPDCPPYRVHHWHTDKSRWVRTHADVV